jgi:hypothetical protein
VTIRAAILCLLACTTAAAQHQHHTASPAEALFHQQASGTALTPAGAPMDMWMFRGGRWSVMVHGVAFGIDLDQNGPRGQDDQFATNWVMAGATRPVGRGALMLRTMLSGEPFTIDERRYPLLFQTGETAFGRAIIDGQHPHDLFMELAAEYARPVGRGLGYVYAAPIGDPAIGPVAFPHRPSASEIPQAVLSHHYQDSTHIASSVVTLGYRRGSFTFETSGFHGGEPDEERTDIELGAIDSVAARVAWSPTPNLTAQVSAAHLEKPEALEPRNATRRTASVLYDVPLTVGRWSASLVWGQVHKQSHDSTLDSYLAESLVQLGRRHAISLRVERNEKDELFPHFHPPNRPDFAPAVPTFTVTSMLAGYTFDVITRPPLRIGIGANITAYQFPENLTAFYGENPLSRAIFIRVKVKG